MSTGVAGGPLGVAVAARASSVHGPVVTVTEDAFTELLGRVTDPLVVHGTAAGFFRTYHRYMFGYKGLVFFVQTRMPLGLPEGIAVIEAKDICTPVGYR
jgi:hypothetical protein